jgi:hypothetical protein
MRDRTGWTRGAADLGRKKNLVEFSRPCATCGKPFSILVTKKIASGKADSNSFGLKNCEEHRRGTAPKRDLEAEIAILQKRDKELFAENMALKAKLAALEKLFPWN